MDKLIKKTFTTTDSRGCEFVCTAYYGAVVEVTEKKLVRDTDYYGQGFKAKSLNELKKIIGSVG